MKFKTILIDPPWRYRDTLGYNTYKRGYIKLKNKTIRGAESHYKTLSDNEILSIPVEKIADDQAHLYLWVTSTHKELGYRVCRSYGFEPKLELVWVKMTKDNHPFMGMGHYYRHSHESIIFGVRGGLQCLNKKTRTVFFAPRSSTHSAKPDQLYGIIESMSPSPRLELFATKKWNGWSAIGDAINGLDIMDSIQKLMEK